MQLYFWPIAITRTVAPAFHFDSGVQRTGQNIPEHGLSAIHLRWVWVGEFRIGYIDRVGQPILVGVGSVIRKSVIIVIPLAVAPAFNREIIAMNADACTARTLDEQGLDMATKRDGRC